MHAQYLRQQEAASAGNTGRRLLCEGSHVENATFSSITLRFDVLDVMSQKSVLMIREFHERNMAQLGQGSDLGTRLRKKLSLFGLPVELDHWT